MQERCTSATGFASQQKYLLHIYASFLRFGSDGYATESRHYAEKFESCPHCKMKRNGKTGCVVFIVVLLAGAALSASLGGPSQAPAPEKETASWCQTFILRQLNDPGSAEFDRTSLNLPASRNKDGSYSRLIELRAKNAFGAMVRTQYWFTVLAALEGFGLRTAKRSNRSRNALRKSIFGVQRLRRKICPDSASIAAISVRMPKSQLQEPVSAGRF